MKKLKRFMGGQVVMLKRALMPTLFEGKEWLVRYVSTCPVSPEVQHEDYAYKLYRPSYPSDHPQAIESHLFEAFKVDEGFENKFFEHELVPTGHFLDQDRGFYNSNQRHFLTRSGRMARVEWLTPEDEKSCNTIRVNAQGEIVDPKMRKRETYDEALDLPLCVAVRKGDWTRIKKLIAQGANCLEISRYGWSAVTYAILKDPDLSFLKYFLDQGIDINAFCTQEGIRERTLLEFAATADCQCSMRFLLEAGAEIEPVHSKIDSCLFRILDYVDVPSESVRILLERGASILPDPQGPFKYLRSLLTAMISRVSPEVISALLKFGADFKLWADWMICFESQQHTMEYLELFLAAGVDINQAEPWKGHTALMKTIMHSHYTAFQRLLVLGAKINTECFSGTNPMYYALLARDDRFFNDLLEREVKLNHQNCWGSTPLMIAARNGLLGKAKRLIELGANLELQDQWGATALMAAVRPGHKEMIEYLLNQGADHRLRNLAGDTAYSIAIEYEHLEIAELLADHHRKNNPPKFQVGDEGWVVAPWGGPVRVDKIKLDALGCHYIYEVICLDEDPNYTPSRWIHPKRFNVWEYSLELPPA